MMLSDVHCHLHGYSEFSEMFSAVSDCEDGPRHWDTETPTISFGDVEYTLTFEKLADVEGKVVLLTLL